MKDKNVLPTTTGTPDIVARAVNDDFIKSRIFSIRGVQVMIDCDLASLYGVETKVLNQAVKRNSARFPMNFMFQLDKSETEIWKSQIVTSNSSEEVMSRVRMGIRRAPYAFTEQGVAMLSAVLRSQTAIATSVRIMNIFAAMRKALASIAPVLVRLDNVERRQITDQTRNDENQQRNEERFDTIFKAMDGGNFPPQKVFFEGKHFEAYSFAKKLVRKAETNIVLVDGYCDDVTLDILAQKKGGVSVLVATTQKVVARHLTPVAVAKFNRQNPTLSVKAVAAFHDRFLILDGKELYHLGASLKDLGRRYCAVTNMDAMFIPSIIQRIQA